jgi:quinol monooxygenase YgiN
MFGLIVKFVTREGKRDEFIRTMSAGFQNMEGCHSYILAEDPADQTAVWVTEIWESAEAHAAAMGQSHVKAFIAETKSKNLFVGRDMRVVTKPIGGQGLFRDGAWRPAPSPAEAG